MLRKVKRKSGTAMKMQGLASFVVSILLGGLLCTAVSSSENPLESDKGDDLAKINSGFFVSKMDVDRLGDRDFKEALRRFLTKKGIVTRSSQGLIYYYVSEDHIQGITDFEMRERVKEFVREAEEKATTHQQPTYTTIEVQPGDTLWNISRAYGMSVDALIRLNNLTPTELIYPGQKLSVTTERK
jgi:hypothetical protein